jgi:hypothetical protein
MRSLLVAASTRNDLVLKPLSCHGFWTFESPAFGFVSQDRSDHIRALWKRSCSTTAPLHPTLGFPPLRKLGCEQRIREGRRPMRALRVPPRIPSWSLFRSSTSFDIRLHLKPTCSPIQGPGVGSFGDRSRLRLVFIQVVASERTFCFSRRLAPSSGRQDGDGAGPGRRRWQMRMQVE